MKLIAHRGLLNGPDVLKENTPEQIEYAIQQGFDVEVDIWYIDSDFYLGHDFATHKITLDFLNRSQIWAHAKNPDALLKLKKNNIHCFWHQEDDYTLTNKGYIWVYPGKPLLDSCILVLPELQTNNWKDLDLSKCSGICSDYVQNIRNDIFGLTTDLTAV
jgi:hypothetical protein